MSLRTATRVGAVVVVLALAACGGPTPPGRDPDVTGTVLADNGRVALVEASDPYYEGMSLLGGDPGLIDAEGGSIASSVLETGDRVEVWIGGPCGESYPVQCEIEAVRVLE